MMTWVSNRQGWGGIIGKEETKKEETQETKTQR